MTATHGDLNASAPASARARYDGVAMTLHWLIALGVFLNIGLGLYMGDLPRSDIMKPVIVGLHMSVGLSILVLALLRIAWRLTHTIPALPGDMAAWQKRLARTVEFLLYALTVAVPLAGWLMISAGPHAHDVNYFGLFTWPHIGPMASIAADKVHAVHEALEDTHVILAWTLAGLAALHILAAIYHQRIRRDGVMTSMLPFG